jgi:transcriptional regulator with XRE-family HTH domain
MAKASKPRTGKADKDIGHRIRLRRVEIKMSQTALADELGMSFQQIQKYETGINRVHASQLQQIAIALGVPVAFLYDGSTASEAQQEVETILALDAKFGLRLLRAYTSIKSRKLRRGLVTLTEAIADGGPS